MYCLSVKIWQWYREFANYLNNSLPLLTETNTSQNITTKHTHSARHVIFSESLQSTDGVVVLFPRHAIQFYGQFISVVLPILNWPIMARNIIFTPCAISVSRNGTWWKIHSLCFRHIKGWCMGILCTVVSIVLLSIAVKMHYISMIIELRNVISVTRATL